MNSEASNQTAAPAPTDAASPTSIVGVGASAGGLEAFTQLLRHLATDTGMAFVLVQHLDPAHESELTRILARATSMPTREVTDNLRVEPNHVYVIPPNVSMAIVEGVLKLLPRPSGRVPNRSVDFFLESLAQDQRERAIGVILSGMATDGTLGLEAIKAEGGITFAQDESAKQNSMPHSAIAADCVDFVLSPENIAKELARIARHSYVTSQPDKSADAESESEDRGSGEASGSTGEGERQTASEHEDDATPLPSGGHGTPPVGAKRARTEAKSDHPRSEDDGFKKTLLILRNHCGVDFSLYKSNTIQRRIARRVILNKLNTLDEYATFLRDNAQELDTLYSDVLISVTSFFRNPDAFEVLKQKVFPQLLKQRKGDEPLRVWVLGCSTGQEAYSIAMSFAEFSDSISRAPKIQIFATDLNNALLDKARHGLYSKTLDQDVSPERLRRFFVEEEGGYRVSKPLREQIVFARQNLISDPPLSRMDLISCRNLMIYLQPSLQKKLIPTFHYALKSGGFLFLGASESIGQFAELFEPADKKQKIFARKAAPTPAFHLPISTERTIYPSPGQRPSAGLGSGQDEGLRAELIAQREADRVSVNQFAPPGVLINAELQILQFRGATGAYLEPPMGKASFDVLKMAREGLMLPLRAAINKAKKENQTVQTENVQVEQNGGTQTVTIQVIPLKNLKEQCFLILFEPTAGQTSRPAPSAPSQQPLSKKEESHRIDALERELAETRDYLQSMHEQSEAAIEELQASHEEVQSANEELQSINEELETSKEELESTNEELTTVNEEMASRNVELSRLNGDLRNLQVSIDTAILLLGRDLTIRRFTPPAEKLFNLLPTDIGRPLSGIRHNLVERWMDTAPVKPEAPKGVGPARQRNDRAEEQSLHSLEMLIRVVIDTVSVRECEVQDKDGRWYGLRVRPYITLDNKLDGAVLVLTDIDALKRSERESQSSRAYAEAIIGTVRDPLLVLDSDLRVVTINAAFYRTFKLRPEETKGRLINELGNGEWNIPKLRNLLEDVLLQHATFKDFEVVLDFLSIGPKVMLLNARRIYRKDNDTKAILLAIEDITERRAIEKEQRELETRFTSLVKNIRDHSIFTLNLQGRITSWNREAERILGYSEAEILGQSFSIIFSEEDQRAGIPAHELRTALSGGHTEDERWHVRKGGERFWALGIVTLTQDANGTPTGFSKILRDMTDRKRAEDALHLADRCKNEFLALLAHELRNPLAPISNAVQVLRHSNGDEEAVQAAGEMMERQVGQMVRLVDDLLDVSRISRGKIELRRRRIDLISAVRDAIQAAHASVHCMNHELTVTLPEQPIYLNADPTRLAQIVGNLLNNASKFTDKGGRIWLTAERNGEQAVIRVRDNGIGIASDQLSRVFDMFTQLDTSLERSVGGLGIGLTVVKNLVELHGGTVEVQSAGIGQGSEFTVRLPVLADETTPPPPELSARPSTPGTGRRILVVDDNHDSADSLAILLKETGHETHTAYDGRQAVEAAATFRPDVVLLDIGLPKLNGYEAARQIRQQPWGKGMMLIAVTGWGQEENRLRSREAGFNAHLVKPVDYAALEKLLATLPS